MPTILEELTKTGKYDPNYNPRVHGLFDPSRNYGKVDKPFRDVRVKELSEWIIGQERSPFAMYRGASRVVWGWKLRYISANYGNPRFLVIPVMAFVTYAAKCHFEHVFDKTKYH